MAGFGESWGVAPSPTPNRRRRRPVYIPPQVNDTRTARRIKLVRRAFPVLKHQPKALLYAAQLDASDDELVKTFAKTNFWDEKRTLVQRLRKMDGDAQRELWDAYSKGSKRTLESLGYSPPDDGFSITDTLSDVANLVPGVKAIRSGLEGDWGGALMNTTPLGGVGTAIDVADDATEALGAGIEQTEKLPVNPLTIGIKTTGKALAAPQWVAEQAMEKVGSPILRGLEVASDLPLHAYRTAALVGEQGEVGIGNMTAYSLNPGDWLDAWEETEDPQSAWYEDARKRAFAHVDGDPYLMRVAQALASGDTVEDVVSGRAERGTPAYERKYMRAMEASQSKEVMRAVKTLMAGVIGPGADLATQVGLDLDSPAGQAVSFGTDFTVQWIFDPFMVGGKLLKDQRLIRALDPGKDLVEQAKKMGADELTRIAEVHGDDWQDQIIAGTLRPEALLNIKGVDHMAMNAYIAEAIRTNQAAEISARFPHLGRYVDDISKYSNEMADTKAQAQAIANGTTKAEELEKVTGIESAGDVQAFLESEAGRTSMLKGHTTRASSPALYELPSLTKRNLRRANLKINIEDKIHDWEHSWGQDEVLLVPDTEVNGVVAEARLVGANLPELAEGHTRLFQVRVGTGAHAMHVAPNYIQDGTVALADVQASNHWWTDSLSRVQAEAANMTGPAGRLHFVDVPTAYADNWSFANHEQEAVRSMAHMPRNEYFIQDPNIVGRSTDIGSVHSYTEIAGRGGEANRILPWKQRPLAAGARMFRMMTHLLPPGDVIALQGDEFVPTVSPYLDLWFTGPQKRAVMSELLADPSPVFRRQVMRAITEDIFHQTGVMRIEDGRKWAEGFLSGMGHKMYGHNGSDIMTDNLSPVRSQISPLADHADGIAVPNARDINKFAQRAKVLDGLYKGVNNDFVDAFMGQFWKPATLLRLSFIPRAAGEELLASVMRYPDLLKVRAGFALDDFLRTANPDETPWLVKPLVEMAEMMQQRLPSSMLNKFGDPGETFAHFLDRKASGWVRGMPEKLATPEAIEAYRDLGRFPAVQRAYVSHYFGMGRQPGVAGTALSEGFIKRHDMGGVEGLHPGGQHSAYVANEDLAANDNFIYIPIINRKGEEVFSPMKVSVSEFAEIDGNAQDFAEYASWVVNHITRDDIRRVTLWGQGAHVHADQAAELSGALYATAGRLDGVGRTGAPRRFLDEMEDTPAKAVKMLRDAGDTDIGDVVWDDLQRYLYYVRGSEHPQAAERAAKALGSARRRARESRDPALVMLTESFDTLGSDLQYALSVRPNKLLRELGPLPEEGAEFNSRQREWLDLFNEAQAGDKLAANKLAENIAFRRLQDPRFQKQVRDGYRFRVARGGRQVAKPVRDGYQRIYFPVVQGGNPGIIESVATSQPRFAEYATDVAGTQRIGQALTNTGQADYIPVSHLATADYDQAVNVYNDILKANPDARVGMHYLDVTDEKIADMHQRSLNLEIPVGQYEYLISPDEMLIGSALDPAGDIQRAADGAALPGITQDEAIRDWAKVIIEDNDHVFRSPKNGRFLHEVGVRGAEGKRYELNWWQTGGPGEHAPEKVFGPKRVLAPEQNLWNRVAEVGFDKVISPAVAKIAREPLFLRNYTERYGPAKANLYNKFVDPDLQDAADGLAIAYGFKNRDELARAWHALPKELKTDEMWDASKLPNLPEAFHGMSDDEHLLFKKFAEVDERARGEIAEIAAHAAFIDTVPYIDDHRIRSQFADISKNLVPFWFAEEQFLKRWARTLVHSPEALARAQLIYQGIKHVGIIQQNEFGEDVFIYPGSSQLHSLMAYAAEKVGWDSVLPISAVFNGEVQMALPGLGGQAPGTPGFGPVIGIPLTVLSERFPEFEEMKNDIMGFSADKSVLEQIIPNSLMRTYRAIAADPDSDGQMASAMIQAMQYMEANNLTPEEGATRDDWQAYNDRVEHWARIILFERAIIGFVGPSVPNEEIPGTELQSEYRDLLRNLSLEEATAEFMKRHPDATAYTVFDRESVSGAPMSSSEEAVSLIKNNGDFITRYPLGGAWFLPQDDFEAPAARDAFNAQVQAGLKTQRTPEEWQSEYYFRRAAPSYFKEKENYEIALDASSSSSEREEIEAAYKDWTTKYFLRNPSFQHTLQSSEGELRRQETIEQLTLAINDPDRPSVPHEGELRTMVRQWQKYQRARESVMGDTSEDATGYRKYLRSTTENWAEVYLRKHPRMRALYERVFMPELEN